MCDHRMFDDPNGLVCNQTGPHDTHTFAATAGADLSSERGEE